MTSTSADNYFFGQNIATHNISIISGQCESLKSSASTETTGVETPELSMVLEKAAGMRLLLLKYCNWILNVVGFQLYYYFFNCIFFLAVLLSSSEFSLLGVLLTDYESREISVEVFVYELLKLISDEEKVNFH